MKTRIDNPLNGIPDSKRKITIVWEKGKFKRLFNKIKKLLNK